MIPRGRVYIVKTRESRTEPSGRQNTKQKNECQMIYHEQILSGSIDPDRIELIHVI